MSILIKGMEKPISCDDCIVPLSKCDFLQRRADECPIVEIPTPHGRIIDIDKVKDELRDQIPCCGLDMTYSNSNAFDTMDNAPTILEAEE